MQEYTRKVHYHETDKMGITHHSNYIKWLEEARIDFMDQIGYGFAQMEKDGISSPVIGLEAEYIRPTTFDDTVSVHVTVEEFRGVKLVLGYSIINTKTEEKVFSGKTSHCFINKEVKPVILKRELPEFDAKLKSLLNK
ncbi:MAG: acyl-CoA thioesterase [Firmicutes bacterium]|nr:acyl-CoA thioesterase [Bacillota bacterium]